MKLVIISMPNNIDINDIKAAAKEFADVLELPAIKVNILEEGDIEIKSASEIVNPIVDGILRDCDSHNPFVMMANFWNLISNGHIDKAKLQTLIAHRNATKLRLKQRDKEQLLRLIDEALTQM